MARAPRTAAGAFAGILLACLLLTSNAASDSSGAGGKLLFVVASYALPLRQRWFTVNANGSGRQELPNGDEVTRAALSPNGKWIAYGCVKALCVSPPSGLPSRVIASFGINDRVAAVDWAPDSRRIVVATRKGIWTVGATGRSLRLIAKLPKRGASSVVWSPRGSHIAFIRNLELGAGPGSEVIQGAGGVYTVDADGSGLREVAVEKGFSEDPASWGADGRRLAFSSLGTLYLVDVRTRRRTRLGSGARPAFSPDDRRIAYEPFDGSLALIGADGRGRKQLGTGSRPVWSPDGGRIAFVSSSRLMAIRPDGKGRHAITTLPGELQQLDWSK